MLQLPYTSITRDRVLFILCYQWMDGTMDESMSILLVAFL
jgi:hypothetical protein